MSIQVYMNICGRTRFLLPVANFPLLLYELKGVKTKNISQLQVSAHFQNIMKYMSTHFTNFVKLFVIVFI